MPAYEYVCANCGSFEVSRPIAEAAAPQACPDCGQPAPRALASPHVRASRAGTRYMAEARNEKSANEPMVEHRLKGTTGHHHAHVGRAQGHVYPSQRPWMIGH
jgi:putative FmdB family regulatory protein